jgi:hypothetical protein
MLIAAIAAFCALAALLIAISASPGSAAKGKDNSFITRHVLSQPELTQLAELLRECPWQMPVDFTGSVFAQGDAKPIDIPVGLGDYKTLPLLLDFWNVNPIPVMPGSAWSGISLDYRVKPLGLLTPAEQRNVMLRYRGPGWTSDRSTYTATTQLRYIPLMAMTGKSELVSLEDVLATEFTEGRETVKGRIEYIERLKNELSPDVYANTMREEVGITYTSWVTGKCFEPWHAEFSPGNGIVREITDPAEREKLHAAAMEIEKTKANQHSYGFLKAHPDSIAYFIAKLYGEKQTIWQAVVWTVRDNEEYVELLDEEIAFAIPKIVEKLKQNTMTEERYSQMSTLDWLLVDYSDSWCGTCQDAGEEDKKVFARLIPILQHGEFLGTVTDLGDLDMPLGDTLIPYEQMTQDEKRAIGANRSGKVELTDKLNQVIVADLSTINGWEDLAAAVLTNYFPSSNTTLAEQLESPYHGYYDWWLSPITRRTFEPWHKEWSRGNGYLRRIDDEATVKKLRGLYLDYARTHYNDIFGIMPDANDIPKYRFFYIRLYGDKPGSIIAEGIWGKEKLN